MYARTCRRRSAQPILALALLSAGLMTISPKVIATEPGWYASLGGRYQQIEDADALTHTPANPGTPGSPADNQCLLANLLGLGALLEALGAIGAEGCLLGLLGPGNPGTDPTAPGVAQTLPTHIRYRGGIAVAGSAGYAFEGGFRPELSLAISRNDWDTVQLALPGGVSPPSRSRNALSSIGLLANLWYDLPLGDTVTPYIGGGLGFQRLAISGELDADDTGLAYQLGAGLAVPLNPRLQVSLDYRYQVQEDPRFHTNDGGRLDTEHVAQQLGLGLRYAFGGGTVTDTDGDGVPDLRDHCPGTPATLPVDTRGCPLDHDGDGVADPHDQCPNTPPNTPVNAQGCALDGDADGVPDALDRCPNTPQGLEVNAQGCPLDSDSDGVPDARDACPGTPPGIDVDARGCPAADRDGDGIADFRDLCPDTPPGLAVSADGCPLDRDGDGIPDHRDECPTSPAGAQVLPNGCALKGDCRPPRPGEAQDRNGCAVADNFILRGVKFEFDSAVLTETARKILDQVGNTLNAYPDIDVSLDGHTDNIGTAAYNLGLSERRAIAVREYLVGRGVAASRMAANGYGVTRPLADNRDEAGREENRRVELNVRED
jgi:OmpA-OmpF porin, OOP family